MGSHIDASIWELPYGCLRVGVPIWMHPYAHIEASIWEFPHEGLQKEFPHGGGLHMKGSYMRGFHMDTLSWGILLGPIGFGTNAPKRFKE